MKNEVAGDSGITGKPKRRVIAVLFPGMVALDLAGPLEAFKYVSLIMGDDIGYDVDCVGLTSSPVEGMSGLKMVADYSYDSYDGHADILLVPGMKAGDTRYRDTAFFEWLRAQAARSKRLVSVCSGAYILAEADLLNGASITTHWAHSDAVRDAFPGVTVCEDKIHMKDGHIYSSGGVTSGVDLALSIIAEDFGRSLAAKIAKRMVVYLHRPGNQAQYSDMLEAQSKSSRFSDMINWIEDNLADDINIEKLSSMCGMGARNFTRAFKAEMNVSPMRYVNRRRLENSKYLLEGTKLPLGDVAKATGFVSVDRFSKAFKEVFDLSPTDYRGRFGGSL